VARKFQFELAPLVLALVIGPMIENYLRLSLIISRGSPWIFFKRPMSAVFILITLALLISPLIPRIGRSREKLRRRWNGRRDRMAGGSMTSRDGR